MTDDDTPAPAPTLILALQWIRREVERTFLNQTPSFAGHDISLTVDKDSTGNVVPAEAVDPDDAVTYTVAPGNGPQHGTVAIDSGTITYTPTAGYTGTDTFTLVATDSDSGFHLHGLQGLLGLFDPSAAGHTDTLTVTVTVTEEPVENQAPTVVVPRGHRTWRSRATRLHSHRRRRPHRQRRPRRHRHPTRDRHRNAGRERRCRRHLHRHLPAHYAGSHRRRDHAGHRRVQHHRQRRRARDRHLDHRRHRPARPGRHRHAGSHDRERRRLRGARLGRQPRQGTCVRHHLPGDRRQWRRLVLRLRRDGDRRGRRVRRSACPTTAHWRIRRCGRISPSTTPATSISSARSTRMPTR